jgi:hypothetical protein
MRIIYCIKYFKNCVNMKSILTINHKRFWVYLVIVLILQVLVIYFNPVHKEYIIVGLSIISLFLGQYIVDFSKKQDKEIYNKKVSSLISRKFNVKKIIENDLITTVDSYYDLIINKIEYMLFMIEISASITREYYDSNVIFENYLQDKILSLSDNDKKAISKNIKDKYKNNINQRYDPFFYDNNDNLIEIKKDKSALKRLKQLLTNEKISLKYTQLLKNEEFNKNNSFLILSKYCNLTSGKKSILNDWVKNQTYLSLNAASYKNMPTAIA